jgi:hypothetical protein
MKIKNIGLAIVLISLFLSACNGQVSLDFAGEIGNQSGSGELDLGIDLGDENDSNDAANDSSGNSASQGNEQINLTSEGLLILLVLVLLVGLGLLFSLRRG